MRKPYTYVEYNTYISRQLVWRVRCGVESEKETVTHPTEFEDMTAELSSVKNYIEIMFVRNDI